jgi:hypothetical protein
MTSHHVFIVCFCSLSSRVSDFCRNLNSTTRLLSCSAILMCHVAIAPFEADSPFALIAVAGSAGVAPERQHSVAGNV